MKYFTWQWLRGNYSTETFQRYREYLATIARQLTPDLLLLEEEISLHDGVLRELVIESSSQSLHASIDADDGEGGYRAIRLQYAGVAKYAVLAANEPYGPGLGGFGHLLYWETHLLPAAFEHRFLFRTGIEMRIVFSEFRLEYRDDKVSYQWSGDWPSPEA